jgi:hypothetical protein
MFAEYGKYRENGEGVRGGVGRKYAMKLQYRAARQSQRLQTSMGETYALIALATRSVCIMWESVKESCACIVDGDDIPEYRRAEPKSPPDITAVRDIVYVRATSFGEQRSRDLRL